MERSSSNITVINEPLTLKKSKLAVLDSPVSLSKSKKKDNDVDRKKSKKRHGPLHMIKLAMLMLDNKSQKEKSTHPTGTSMWKKIVCSMRPLHLQNDVGSPPRITSPPPVTAAAAVVVVENLEVFTPPMSPTHLSTTSSDTMSQYASAVNLQDLDQEDIKHDDQENGFYGGDEMIDVKAELFIAQFYQQMRLQHDAEDY